MPAIALPADVAETVPTTDPASVLIGRGYAAEPKLDGWRGVLAGHAGVLHTRARTRVESWFPELVDAARALGDVVLDGEIVTLSEGWPAFGRLQSRRRGPRRGEDFTVHFAAWDILAIPRTDVRSRPYTARRAELERRLAHAPERLSIVPSTTNPGEVDAWWEGLVGSGLAEGLVFKPLTTPYRAGRGSGWLKQRRVWTREFVVVGVTAAGRSGAALVLGAPARGRLRPVAVTLPIPPSAHRDLAPLLRPAGGEAELPGTVGGLPGADRIRYQPVEPVVVVEVAADAAVEFGRLRHRPHWGRIRADVRPEDVAPLGDTGEAPGGGEHGEGTRGG